MCVHAAFIRTCNLERTSVIKMGVQVLTFGQAYQVSLLLEMPDSPVNQALGMFMIRTTFYSQGGGQVVSSSQPVRRSAVCYPLVLCEAKILLCFDSLHHCPVLLRQDTCCRPPALDL